MYPHYYYTSGFFGFGIWPFIIILGVIFLIWAIFHRKDEDIPEEYETALEILKKRYAKGEITKKEFLEMKKDIE
jgi:putative membrane protein